MSKQTKLNSFQGSSHENITNFTFRFLNIQLVITAALLLLVVTHETLGMDKVETLTCNLPTLRCAPIGWEGEPAPPSCIELTNREQADTGVLEYVRAAEMLIPTYYKSIN